MREREGPDPRSRIDYGYRLVTGRHAKPDELNYLIKYEAEDDWTMVANVLLNLDETITKE